jgi:hypothetical protein
VELLRRDEIGNAIVFCRTKHRRTGSRRSWRSRVPDGADPRQPQPGAAHGGAGGLQERHVPRAGGDGHRGPRHRRRGARARGELRRAERAGGLHPPRRPHGARGRDRRRLHVRVAGGGDGHPRIERAVGRSIERRRPCAGLRLPRSAAEERLEVPIGERIAADPRPQGGGAFCIRRPAVPRSSSVPARSSMSPVRRAGDSRSAGSMRRRCR